MAIINDNPLIAQKQPNCNPVIRSFNVKHDTVEAFVFLCCLEVPFMTS